MSTVKMWSSSMIPTFLLLSFFSVGLAPNPGSATYEKDSYPPFWEQINGDIAEFPVQNNKIIIDPWKYINRLQMYKILITTTSRYFVSFERNNTYNVFWALTLFYGKLYKTAINFYVIVLTFLAAIESEFLRDLPYEVKLVPREEYRSDFCYSVEECRASYPKAMDAANRLFQYLQSREILFITRDVPTYNTDEDTAIFYMWEAHQAAIDIGKPKFTSDISFYSSETERDFTADFLLTIEFWEAALHRPYFESSTELLVGFPHRPLSEQDRNFFTSTFSIREKALLNLVKITSERNKITGGMFLTVWKLMNLKLGPSIGRFLIKRNPQ